MVNYSMCHMKGSFGVTIVTEHRFGSPATDGSHLYETRVIIYLTLILAINCTSMNIVTFIIFKM